MSDYTAKRLDDMEASHGGGFVKARAELGVSSFGVQVIRLPPDADGYPEHDHTHDGQEEVYIALQGGGRLEIEGESVELDGPNVFVRVGAGTKRKVYAGPDGLSVLVLGGAPGEAYKITEFTELEAS
jgi:quercetin dioxygenase-like cupin family protein